MIAPWAEARTGRVRRVQGIARAMLTVAIAGAMAARPLEAQNVSESQAEAFRRELLAALARDDRPAVARMVRYRLVIDAGILVPIANAAALYEHWDVVFPPETRCLIEGSGLAAAGSPPPRYEMRVESGRVTFGDGRITAERGADGLKVSSMRLPPGFGSGSPGKPREVVFRWGKGRSTYAGRLTADNVDTYLLQAREGDLLNAQLARVRADRAAVRIVREAGNKMLPPSAPRGANTSLLWAGRVPATGQYRIEVVRRAAYCDPPVNYQLTLSLE